MSEEEMSRERSDSSENQVSVNRRGVLKTIGSVGTVGFTGLIGSVNAVAQESQAEKSKHEKVRSNYKSERKIKSALEEYSQSLLENLQEENFVESEEIQELNAFEHTEKKAYKNEFIKIMSTFDYQTQTLTAVIRITEKFKQGKTNIFVLPESERNYAMIDLENGESFYKTTTPNQVEQVTIDDSGNRIVGTINPTKIEEINKEEMKTKSVGVGEVSQETVTSDDFDDCEYVGETSFCTNIECLTLDENCYQVLPCTTILHEREDMRVYSCDNQTQYEIYNSVCTNECCEDSGTGCDCASFGCSAQ